LSSHAEQIALLFNGRKMVLRGAVSGWPPGQAVRRRMMAIENQPNGPALTPRNAASSLGCVLAYAPSLFLALHGLRAGATHSAWDDKP
jgi:hypothetical protein